MKPVEVTASASTQVDYGEKKVSVGITAEVDPETDDVDQCMAALQKKCEKKCAERREAWERGESSL